MKRLCIFALCGMLLGATAARAIGFSGDVSVTALATDAPLLTDEPVTRVPVWQTLTMKLGDFGDERLSFAGSFRSWFHAYGDVSDSRDLRVLHSYFHWNDRATRFEAKFGRQFVSAGVGRAYFDGVFARKGFSRTHELSAYAGQPLIDVSASSWNTGSTLWGAHYRYRGFRSANVGMSYTEQHDGDGTALRLVGVDATYRRSLRETIRIRSDVDFAKIGVDRLSVRWLRQLEGGHLVSALAQYRHARIWATSPLRDITAGHYAQVTVSGMYAIERNTRLYLAVSGVNAGAAPGATVDAGVNWRMVRAGYLFASTGAVIGNSFYVQGSHRLNDRVLVGGRTNFGYYELDHADDASHSLGSALFATITPMKRLDITAEVQHVTNTTYAYQFQGLITARYRFSHLAN